MSMPRPSPTDSWTIVSQVPDQDFPATGGIVSGVRVGFRTGSGILDSVFVPNDKYGDTDWIKTQIQTKVTQHAAVSQLNG